MTIFKCDRCGKEINFKYIVDEMKEKYGIDLDEINLVVEVKKER